MYKFCRVLTDSLRSRFNIEVDVFVSKKKKIVHMSLMKPLISDEFFKDILKFIEKFWCRRQKFYSGYFFIYPKLNQNIKWRFNYIIVNNNRYKIRKKYGRFTR